MDDVGPLGLTGSDRGGDRLWNAAVAEHAFAECKASQETVFCAGQAQQRFVSPIRSSSRIVVVAPLCRVGPFDPPETGKALAASASRHGSKGLPPEGLRLTAGEGFQLELPVEGIAVTIDILLHPGIE